jgi:hypothetical protein
MKQLLFVVVFILPTLSNAQMLSKSVSDSLNEVMYQKSMEVREGDKTAIFILLTC